MSTVTTEKYFRPKQELKPVRKPSFSEKVRGLFGKVDDRQHAEKQQRATDYQGLVRLLADIEISGEGTLPSEDEILAILKSDEKSLDDLRSDVERLVTISKHREELKGEPDALEVLAETNDTIEAEEEEWKRAVAQRIARVDQLLAERTERFSRVEHFKRIRTKLNTIGGEPSAREKKIGELLTQSVRDEANLTRQAGHSCLPEKFVKTSFDEVEAEVITVETKLEEQITRKDHVRPGPKLREEIKRVEDIRDEFTKDERLYRLGGRIRTLREERTKLSAEREQLRTDRFVAIEKGDVTQS